MKPPKHAPIPGRVYRHYRAGLYCVECLARHSETKEWMVVYRSYQQEPVQFWCRPLAHWLEKVEYDERVVPRFGETALVCPGPHGVGLVNPEAPP